MAALGGAFVGAWLGFLVTVGLFAVVTTIVGARSAASGGAQAASAWSGARPRAPAGSTMPIVRRQ